MTENELVYRILEIVKLEKVAEDRADPRVVRAFLRNYRASKLRVYSNEGITVDDEVFQFLGNISFSTEKNPIKNQRKEFVTNDVPTIIRLKENFGIYFIKNGYNIPVQNSESYDLDFFDNYNKFLPRIKAQNHSYTLFIGSLDGCKPKNPLLEAQAAAESLATGEVVEAKIPMSDTQMAVQAMHEEFINGDEYKVELPCWAVLNNPEDAPGYDWKVSPYPYPNEIVDQLVNSVLAREFNIYLQRKSDSIGNAREDNIRFSDEQGYEGQE